MSAEFRMREDDDRKRGAREACVQRLVAETGITETQARELVAMLGLQWCSLVREARNLKR